MTRAFWMFAENAGDGSKTNPSRPAFPVGVGGKMTNPGDIIRLTGPAAAPHRHLLVGGIALADDNLDGLTGEGHVHYVYKVDDVWQQVTVDAPNHNHVLNVSASGVLIPEYFMLFWMGHDADALAIAGSSDCFPIVEAVVTEDGGEITIGPLEDGWAMHDAAWWQAIVLDILGMQLPVEVDQGKLMVQLFLGSLLSRNTSDERGYRFQKW